MSITLGDVLSLLLCVAVTFGPFWGLIYLIAWSTDRWEARREQRRYRRRYR